MFRRLENELHRSSDQLDRDRERDRDFERDRDLDRDLKIGGRKVFYILVVYMCTKCKFDSLSVGWGSATGSASGSRSAVGPGS